MPRLGALPTDWRDFGRSLVPLALLALAAAFPILRLPVLLALVAGPPSGSRATRRFAGAGRPQCRSRSASPGGFWPAPLAAADGSDCANPMSPVATWRALEAIVVLATLGVLAATLRAPRGSLFLRWPARAVVRWSIAGFLVAGPLALVLGPILARPFFGQIDYSVTALGAIVPALVFAVANGSMEELAYRGALLGWSARVMGVGPAVVGQAVVFGLAHSGADVAGNGLVLSLALGVGGLIAGVIAVRTRSLLLPMAIHIGLDIPIYYAFACTN